MTSVARQKVDMRQTFYFDTRSTYVFCQAFFNLCMLTDTLWNDTTEAENGL